MQSQTNGPRESTNLLSEVGSIAGIKVDTGAKQMAGSPNEKITEGLDGLRERLNEYYKLGARFTKKKLSLKLVETLFHYYLNK